MSKEEAVTSAGEDDGSSVRLYLGPKASKLVKERAEGGRITARHLESVLEDLEGEVKAFRNAGGTKAFDNLTAAIDGSSSRHEASLAALNETVVTGFERLLNGINGIRYMFEMFAIQLSGGDLQQALHDVNERIDALSKPISVSKSEVELRRQAEREDGLRAAAEAEQHDHVMEAIDGGSTDMVETSLAGKDAAEELEL